MEAHRTDLQWAPKVSQAQIRRLYVTDARGIVDDELIDQVAWALWSRCASILEVTAAHYGTVRCPSCATLIARAPERDGVEIVSCTSCGWQLPWTTYHRSYRGKQLFAGNAGTIFEAYHRALPTASAATAKMVLIDQLIHAFHAGLTEPGRPVAANLIEGSLGTVIAFLDALTHAGTSATGLGDSRTTWRRTLASAAWADAFVERATATDGESNDGPSAERPSPAE